MKTPGLVNPCATNASSGGPDLLFHCPPRTPRAVVEQQVCGQTRIVSISSSLNPSSATTELIHNKQAQAYTQISPTATSRLLIRQQVPPRLQLSQRLGQSHPPTCPISWNKRSPSCPPSLLSAALARAESSGGSARPAPDPRPRPPRPRHRPPTLSSASTRSCS